MNKEIKVEDLTGLNPELLIRFREIQEDMGCHMDCLSAVLRSAQTRSGRLDGVPLITRTLY